ncbi:MAG: nucleoside-diphosphate kinase [Deltaproteobacteria bacterium]|nr:nucleoside-diphosphate kinase [Deltaproteobacteria bacterium]MCX7953155.1 nucleoside-diphosphate kinase [Deltaproteobacteria bacterium]
MAERTLILIKPDGINRNLIGTILARFEGEGLKILALKMFKFTKGGAENFYAMHREKPFFEELTSWMSSQPIVAAILESENAISKVRDIVGATNPAEARQGTIRALYGTSVGQNVVHASDSQEAYEKEVRIVFPEGIEHF